MSTWKEVIGEDKKGKPGNRHLKRKGDNLEVICHMLAITIALQCNL